MPKYKLVKAKCGKTGKKFVMQVAEDRGELVGCFMVDPQAYDALATQIDVSTINKCAPCPTCGTTKPFSCEHQYKATGCPMDRAATRACLSCKHAQVIYGGAAVDSPYGQWAGTSVIEGVELDEHGNPKGSQYDLAKDGAFKGYVINILKSPSSPIKKSSLFIAALNRKGFEVKLHNMPIDDKKLNSLLDMPNSQLWLISRTMQDLTDRQISNLYDYMRKGYGVYLWGDNAPFVVDTNRVLERYFGTKLQGNYRATKVIGVQEFDGEPGIVANHFITTGIINIYEGITVSHFNSVGTMRPLMYNSECKLLALYYSQNGFRVIADGGYTRLYDEYFSTTGTDRYITNAAAWLANIEGLGYNPKFD